MGTFHGTMSWIWSPHSLHYPEICSTTLWSLWLVVCSTTSRPAVCTPHWILVVQISAAGIPPNAHTLCIRTMEYYRSNIFHGTRLYTNTYILVVVVIHCGTTSSHILLNCPLTISLYNIIQSWVHYVHLTYLNPDPINLCKSAFGVHF